MRASLSGLRTEFRTHEFPWSWLAVPCLGKQAAASSRSVMPAGPARRTTASTCCSFSFSCSRPVGTIAGRIMRSVARRMQRQMHATTGTPNGSKPTLCPACGSALAKEPRVACPRARPRVTRPRRPRPRSPADRDRARRRRSGERVEVSLARGGRRAVAEARGGHQAPRQRAPPAHPARVHPRHRDRAARGGPRVLADPRQGRGPVDPLGTQLLARAPALLGGAAARVVEARIGLSNRRKGRHVNPGPAAREACRR